MEEKSHWVRVIKSIHGGDGGLGGGGSLDCFISRWTFDDEGVYKDKTLSKIKDSICLKTSVGQQETIWCNLVPKKVNDFICTALKRRLPVHVELDKRGIDIHSLLLLSVL